ncbi:MAG: hypothetical protein J5651_00990 [Salinivirgaceae bacterium]|nr:hypothetical protein [Salinivirgaceae bacterium]MBO7432780.1 hypothetical protein [Salinivirgaceae bacterium]MBO7594750.1 hypothetical protein [Salinivirgaceae bacterium]MBR5168720.1 hypothetical protein [Salinivirgaceae bacterium]
MNRKITTLLSILIAGSSLLMIDCSGNGSKKTDDMSIPDSIFENKPLLISKEAMNDIIDNISSPVEMAALIKSAGAPFNQKYLAQTNNVDNLNTNFKQALNLGVYGCDLGYLNMYEKTGSIMVSMTAIKKLADELRIGQFFDFNTIKRLATNNENLDSLMYISVASFNNMDEFLRESNRSNISALLVTGMWIEGMYLACQVVKENPERTVIERIGDSKMVLNSLILILRNYKSDPAFANLVKEIEKIKKEYEAVTVRYEAGEPEAKEVDGMLIIIQNDKQIVDISDETLANITVAIENARNMIINL